MLLTKHLRQAIRKSEGYAARALNFLPLSIQEKIPQYLSYPYDYPNLDPGIRCLMAIQYKQGYDGFITRDIHYSRANFESQMKNLCTKKTRVKHIKNIFIELNNIQVQIRHYNPLPSSALPMIVFYHGGGFVVGSIETHDEVCRLLSNNANVQVISVEYPLAPEYSPSEIIQCCEDVLVWIYDNKTQFNISDQGIAVAGDSAGGNIATVLAQRTKRKNYEPKAQLLIYPVVDSKTDYPSKKTYQNGLVLTSKDLKVATDLYVNQHNEKLDNKLISPLFGELDGVAPICLITAGYDVLHDEAEEYKNKLEEKGNSVEYKEYPHQTHGFVNLTFVSDTAKKDTIEIAKIFRKFWDMYI